MTDIESTITDALLVRFKERKDAAKGEDVPPVVEFLREDNYLAALVYCRQIDRDDALEAIRIGTSGFNADRVVACLDSHYTEQPINPATGEMWGPGEMQAACDEGDACQVGLLTDCLAIMEGDRDGTLRQVTLPYHVDKATGAVHWGEPAHRITCNLRNPDDGGERVSGRIPDAFMEAFDIPKFIDAANESSAPATFGLEPWQAEISIRCVTAKVLGGTGRYEIALGLTTDDEVRWASESFEKGPELPSLDVLRRMAQADQN